MSSYRGKGSVPEPSDLAYDQAFPNWRERQESLGPPRRSTEDEDVGLLKRIFKAIFGMGGGAPGDASPGYKESDYEGLME